MSMSMFIVGFVPPDGEWKRMKAVWDACEIAKIDPPKEVLKFFNWETPEPHGVKIDLEDVAERYSDDGDSGYELKLEDVPEHVRVIRFYNSW